MDNTLPVSSIAVPPTTNDLDPQQKALLLKKTRKLSRVFGEEPSSIHQASQSHPHAGRRVGRDSSSSSCSSSSHRRSMSSLSTCTSQSSPRLKQVVRRAPSQPNIRASLLVEPVPRLPHDAKAPEDADHSGVTPPPEQLQRLRIAKLRRYLGEDRLPSELVTTTTSSIKDDLRFRKSLDAMPVIRRSSRRSSEDKTLRRSRSTLLELPKNVEPLVDDPVAFHRRYVQNFGCEGRVTQASRRKHQQVKFEEKSPPAESTSGRVKQPPPLSPSPGFFSVAGAMEDRFVRGNNTVLENNELDSGSLPSQSRFGTGFQERRRRAAKLAQFFGVGYHDLSSSLTNSDLVSHSSSSSSYRESPQTIPTVQVDIAMKSRRFWGSGDERWTCKDADMLDVIDKLRDLKA
ncbi:hypothetical protein L218DRAFT_993001 [Marasmius fiardii PR-910]|nr:hypothetical protein L218DRAFT_993001 [Marasmius fiardii PR-910]